MLKIDDWTASGLNRLWKCYQGVTLIYFFFHSEYSLILNLYWSIYFIGDHVFEFSKSQTFSEIFFPCRVFCFFLHFFPLFLKYFFRLFLFGHSTSTFSVITFPIPFTIHIVFQSSSYFNAGFIYWLFRFLKFIKYDFYMLLIYEFYDSYDSELYRYQCYHNII